MSQLVQKRDLEIQRRVLDELKWDTRVLSTDVGVEVQTGVVTLTGTVDSWAASFAAQEAAHRVSGVFDVANDIVVKLPGSSLRDDTDIAKATRMALEWDVLVPDDRIRTTVTNGVVTLEGKVDFWSEYQDAERAIRNLAGVRAVNNLLRVQPPSNTVSALGVRVAIEQALDRHAEHSAKHVHITMAEGKVVLSGEVHSWAERAAIEAAARGTTGVSVVDNHLSVHLQDV